MMIMSRRSRLWSQLISPLLLLLLRADFSKSDSSKISAISVSPSLYWDGNDGPWSTFAVQVGTPPQNVRVIPASGASSLWVVVSEGCTPTDPTSCVDDRGWLYQANKSSTWQHIGLYGLPLVEEEVLGYSVNALTGRDTVTLGWQGDGLPTIQNHVVAGIASKALFLGSLGLTPRPENVTSINEPIPSMLTVLKNQTVIPSLSWGYTAGAYWTSPKTFGSLTLGGYDKSRFTANQVSFNFGVDQSRDLLVGISSITASVGGYSDTPVLSTGIFSFIDSLVPDIWLPLAACQSLEQALGIVYDNATKLYLISDDVHEKLTDAKASLSFKLTPSLTDQSKTVVISIPYEALALTAKYPLIKNSSARYFPLKRADNDTQYTLGRSFLQSSYIIVDYERNIFSVSQALYPDQNIQKAITPIEPVSKSGSGSGNGSKLATGAIAGIAVGGAAVVLLGLAAIWLVRRRGGKSSETTPDSTAGSRVDQGYRSELDGGAAQVHLLDDTKKPRTELAAEEGAKYEMLASIGDPKRGEQLAGIPSAASAEPVGPHEVYEMSAGEITPLRTGTHDR